METRGPTDRLSGEEAEADVPSEAADEAHRADARIDEMHRDDDPDRPISES